MNDESRPPSCSTFIARLAPPTTTGCFYNGAIRNTSGNTMCGYIADHYARFTKNGTQTNPLVRQYVTIPSNETKTHWAADAAGCILVTKDEFRGANDE